MNPNIAELASDELGQIRNKINLVAELVSHYVSDQKHPVYRLLMEASVALEKAESELHLLKGGPDRPPA